MAEHQHAWDVSEEEARAIQTRLRPLVQKTNGFKLEDIKTIAGIDVSLKDQGQAAIVVLSFPELEVVDEVAATGKITFPYVPGLLSFREVPLILEAYEKLKVQPDILLVDGQGYAHPRRFGIACHVGVFLDKPSIGCGKSILVGKHGELGLNKGDQVPLTHGKETIGTVLRSKNKVNPLIISIGHKIDLPTAVEVVNKCLRAYRVPEPIRAAHNFAGSVNQIGGKLVQAKLF